jgi:atlastin
VLLDTQGTFDSQTSMKENTFIFALSTLLSSVQIYNLHERIQMDDLSNLQVTYYVI